MDIKDGQITMLPLSQLVLNSGQINGVPANPRFIRDEEYNKLKASLAKSNLTGVLPLKVYACGNNRYIILGGNMRFRALKELGVKEVACIIVPETDAETLRQIVIDDNSNFGEWDMDMLGNDWNIEELKDWGVEVPEFGADVSSLLDAANFESLIDAMREKTNMRQITFLFSKEDADAVNAYIEANTKQVLQEKIVELCQLREAK